VDDPLVTAFPLAGEVASAGFVYREQRLVIEVDGGQHADSPADKVRDQWIVSHNYRVMRFWNNDVPSNIDGVLMTINDAANR
jgi:very-short-patch-repair endonuclease